MEELNGNPAESVPAATDEPAAPKDSAADAAEMISDIPINGGEAHSADNGNGYESNSQKITNDAFDSVQNIQTPPPPAAPDPFAEKRFDVPPYSEYINPAFASRPAAAAYGTPLPINDPARFNRQPRGMYGQGAYPPPNNIPAYVPNNQRGYVPPYGMQGYPAGGYDPGCRPQNGAFQPTGENPIPDPQRPMPEYGMNYAAAAPLPQKKRLSGRSTALIIVIISVMFLGLLILLLISSMNDTDTPAVEPPTVTKTENVTIELPIQPKPKLESKYYQDEETGLLTTTGVAQRVSPSVVDVIIYKDTTLYPYSQGSGIIISEDGYIVTNAHVVTDANAGVKVVLDNDNEYKATVVGQDSKTDIAVLKIEPEEELVVADLGDSSQLVLGEMVVAIGNAGGYSGSLTVGYVSGLDREVRVANSDDTMTCIQTDAAMSPGVSGGALINMYGQVVGITSSKYKSTDLDEGIGFAITTQFAKPIIEDIISKGYISGRVRVGITYTPLDSTAAQIYGITSGLYVQTIAEECDISNTELMVGDIITMLNGKQVYSSATIRDALDGCKPGDRITAHVYRQGITESETKEFDIEFELMQDTDLK